ncbi:hypothetical protein [Kamptonema sp. UHCC 0994]|uniref:hypothetical protein n=1 Tax=Kamptonema sp. UHCC 0994 TaxID=3031329 RepID=UPI0023B8DD12|nr:hypothetical protein [Kamptonema sp. UHCC 0994]MDF0552195.1 hypothetical protein [Kamptonema sp. UHCC 0994]
METDFEEMETPKNTKRDAIIAKVLWGAAILGTVTMILPIMGQLLSNQPKKIGEPVAIKPPAESVIEATEKNSSIARNEAWTKVQATCQTGLQSEFANTDRELELGRAQRWQAEARNQAVKQKITEYEWLTNAYLAYSGRLQEFTKSGQFPTDANSANKYRELKAILSDIATALSTSGAALRPTIVTEDLNNAVDSCYESAVAYQNLRSNHTEEIGGSNQGETP